MVNITSHCASDTGIEGRVGLVGLPGLVHDYYSANPFRIVHSAAGTLVFLINTR